MPKWTEYTTKDTLADNDEVMLYDATARANKRGLMSKFWDYVVDKMATAVISKLETNNKTIIGAINALNSESKKSFIKDAGDYDYDQYTPKQAAEDIIDNKLNANTQIIQFIGFICASKYFMIVQKHTSDYCSYILFGYAADNIAYHVKRNGKWE